MIPDWNGMGILPPVRPGRSGNSAERSPYKSSLLALVQQFANSPERIAILRGYLDYREQLHKIGVSSGFQWLDGSFFEAIEILEGRPPNDLDVVTYYRLPMGESQMSLFMKAESLFDNEHVKATFKVDSYMQQLGKILEDADCTQIAYWYSMWSHRRDGIWKGFVQVDLAPVDDREALGYLETLMVGDGDETH